MLVKTKLNLAPLMSPTAFEASIVTVPVLGFGIKPRAENLAESADFAHHVRRRNNSIEVSPTTLDLLKHVVCSDEIRPRLASLIGFLATREHEYSGGFSRSVGKVDRATDHLVRLSRIDAHTHGHIDRWIELQTRCP